MDTPTHMLLGGVAAYALFGRSAGRRAAAAGALAALLPDLDVFLAPFGDPALPYELHRHATHALIVAPIIGLLGAAPFLLGARSRERARPIIGAGIVGALTHGLLDQLTSYGTHLWWPFVSHRTSWDSMSIIDPIMTLTLFFGLLAALVGRKPNVAVLSFLAAFAYAGFGVVQRERAGAVQRLLAEARGDEIEHARVMPTLGNLVLWRSLYRTPDGQMHADAVRIVPFRRPQIREGKAPRAVVRDEDLPAEGSEARERLNRFLEFTDGFASIEPGGYAGIHVLRDERFSLDTAGFVPLWGVAFDPRFPDDTDALQWTSFTEARRDALAPLLAEILGRK